MRVGVFSDGLYVMRTTGADLALLGGRVTAIDGKPIEVVMERLAALRGGTAAWRRLYAALYLSDPEILFGTDIPLIVNIRYGRWRPRTAAPRPSRWTLLLRAR